MVEVEVKYGSHNQPPDFTLLNSRRRVGTEQNQGINVYLQEVPFFVEPNYRLSSKDSNIEQDTDGCEGEALPNRTASQFKHNKVGLLPRVDI